MITSCPPLPESIGNLTSLQELELSDNRLLCLPKSFGSLTSLQGLGLGYNKLFRLPESIGDLTFLQELDIEKNDLFEKNELTLTGYVKIFKSETRSLIKKLEEKGVNVIF